MGIYTKKPSPSREHRNVHQKGQKKTSKHAFLMIHHQHLMVCLQFFPSSFFLPPTFYFLSDFISWPFLRLVSCFQITILPKGEGLLYHLPLCIPPLSSVFCPHGDQSLLSVLSSQACISSSFSPSFLQRPDPCPPPTLPQKIVKVKLFFNKLGHFSSNKV